MQKREVWRLNELEKFIKQYVRNKRTAESESGYSAWLRKNRVTDDEELRAEAVRLIAESELTDRGRGSDAEFFRDSGLARSGYAGYLGDKLRFSARDGTERADAAAAARRTKGFRGFVEERLSSERKEYADRKEAEIRAEEERLNAEKEAKRKAELEAEKESSERKSLIRTARSRLEGSAIIDIEKATKLAMDIGLSEEDARALAEATTKVAREEAIRKVLSAIVNRRYTKNQAREYAIWLGLSSEDVKALSETAFKNNESPKDMTAYEDYLEYLDEKIKNSN